jgi:FAD:protein FMN transferase
MSAWEALSFRAMGSSCRIVAPDLALARHGRQLVRDLEARWSRFLPSSEVSALNHEPGRLTVVSPDTFELVDCAQRAREATGGRFNPLMLDQLCALGYDRSWAQVDRDATALPDALQLPGPATDAPIDVFPEISAVRLPPGARFDPGGIGKGLAGDMVARALLAAGASSVQVELGGDVRVVGPEWSDGQWRVMVDDTVHHTVEVGRDERGDERVDERVDVTVGASVGGSPSAATISLAEGGVATSSVMGKRWQRGGSTLHHLLDPRTGRPADTDLEAVTAVGPTLWWAEVVAKVALMSGAIGARTVMEEFGMTGVIVRTDPAARYDVVAGPIGTTA